MPDYNNGKIYKIWCVSGECDGVYVGSTTQSLAKRWGGHKKASHPGGTRKLYQVIADNWDAWRIELVELYPCVSKMELNRREGEVIRDIGTLNQRIAGRTDKEYCREFADLARERQREWVKNNREYKNEKKRTYYAENKEKINQRKNQLRREAYAKMKAEDTAEYQRKNQLRREAYRERSLTKD